MGDEDHSKALEPDILPTSGVYMMGKSKWEKEPAFLFGCELVKRLADGLPIDNAYELATSAVVIETVIEGCFNGTTWVRRPPRA